MSTVDINHDFDFEIGTWKTHVRRLLRPLTGSTTWVEMEGITTVRKVGAGGPTLSNLWQMDQNIKTCLEQLYDLCIKKRLS